MKQLSRILGVLALVTPLAGEARAEVWIVDASGQGEHTSLQAAVDAARSGDTLLVRAGTYGGFTIAHKSLSVVADAGASVSVNGRVQVVLLAPWQEVSLAGLNVAGGATEALLVSDCEGSVRVREGQLGGRPRAVHVLRSGDVALIDCSLIGSDGGIPGANGASALVLAQGSKVALHGCLLQGGDGADGSDGSSCFGDVCTDGGFGGSAAFASNSSFLYAADSHFERGTAGVGGDCVCYCTCDDGDDGGSVGVDASSTAVVLDCSLQGGHSASVVFLPGGAKRIELERVLIEHDAPSLVLRGAPGDRVRLFASPSTTFEYQLERRGVELAGEPFPSVLVGADGPARFGRLQRTGVAELVLPPSGSLSIPLRVLPLEPGTQAAAHQLQALFLDAAQSATWSNVVVTQVLAQSAFVIDCPPGACPQPALVYVDDDAPGDPAPGDSSVGDPLEDGSAEHPFDSIQEAVLAVAVGGEVVVRDGHYTGLGNRNVRFLGRALTLRSENGPASCILDAGGVGSVLRLVDADPAATTVRGFTITGGAAAGIEMSGASSTIESCVIRENSNTFDGGGIRITGGSPRILRCWITENSAPTGGGIRASGTTADIRVRSCWITRNSAEYGAGIYSSARNLRVEGVTIADNPGNGVLIAGGSGTGTVQAELLLTDSIVWGSVTALRLTPSSARATVRYTDLQGGQAGVGGSGILTWGLGNIDQDPLFVDSGAGDHHLTADSPCVDRGDPSWVPESGELDLDGDPRVLGTRVDMGGDELLRDCNGNGIDDRLEGLAFDSPMLTPIGADAPQSFTIPAPPAAVGPVLLEAFASADLGDQNERIRVRINGTEHGVLFSQGAHDCPFSEDRAVLLVSAAAFNGSVAGGDATLLFLPSSTVDSSACGGPFLYCRLVYDNDCNRNGVLDSCELADGSAVDANGNGVIDSCE